MQPQQQLAPPRAAFAMVSEEEIERSIAKMQQYRHQLAINSEFSRIEDEAYALWFAELVTLNMSQENPRSMTDPYNTLALHQECFESPDRHTMDHCISRGSNRCEKRSFRRGERFTDIFNSNRRLVATGEVFMCRQCARWHWCSGRCRQSQMSEDGRTWVCSFSGLELGQIVISNPYDNILDKNGEDADATGRRLDYDDEDAGIREAMTGPMRRRAFRARRRTPSEIASEAHRSDELGQIVRRVLFSESYNRFWAEQREEVGQKLEAAVRTQMQRSGYCPGLRWMVVSEQMSLMQARSGTERHIFSRQPVRMRGDGGPRDADRIVEYLGRCVYNMLEILQKQGNYGKYTHGCLQAGTLKQLSIGILYQLGKGLRYTIEWVEETGLIISEPAQKAAALAAGHKVCRDEIEMMPAHPRLNEVLPPREFLIKERLVSPNTTISNLTAQVTKGIGNLVTNCKRIDELCALRLRSAMPPNYTTAHIATFDWTSTAAAAAAASTE